MNPIQTISNFDLALISGLLFLSGIISVLFRLQLGKKLLIAGARTMLQLFLLGYVLHALFAAQNPIFISLILLFMLAMAAGHVLKRPSWTFQGSYIVSFFSITTSTLVVAVLVTQCILKIEPWYDPQYLIPLFGMILGNSLNGLSFGLEKFLSSVHEKKEELEQRLCLGASVSEALRPLVRDGIQAGHIPILNAMTAAGIISLPGMMTGQILSGVEPLLAVRYQILVMFMISAACSLGVTIFILWTARRLQDSWQRLRIDRLTSR